MSSSYRAVFARPGARALALACALGWLSFASYGLALVLAVEHATGSFAVAGGVVAAFSAGSALLAPERGRIVDRRGAGVLPGFAALHGAALVVVVVGCAWEPSPALLIGAAAVGGMFVPPLIATARAVWPGVTGPELARTGHALNAALGDAATVAGPALTGSVAALVSPVIALALLIPGAAAGAWVLRTIAPAARPRNRARRRARAIGPAMQSPVETEVATPRSERPRRRGWAGMARPRRGPIGGGRGALARSRRGPTGGARRRGWGVLAESRGLQVVVATELLLGLAFGALDVAAPAVADASGAAALAAIPLAAFAVSSVVVSLLSGTDRVRWSPVTRYVAGCGFLAVVLLGLLVVGHSPAGMTAVLLVAGAGFGLANVAIFELIERLVPADGVVEAFTWLTTWSGIGLAIGAVAAGQLAAGGTAGPLLAVALPAVAAAGVAFAMIRTV